MSILRPKHPLVKALFAFASALWYVVVWRRGKKPVDGKVVDAEGKIVDEKGKKNDEGFGV